MAENKTFVEIFPVEKGDFIRAGEVSSDIKRLLRHLGVDAGILRNVAVAAYEAEMNLIIHSLGGEMEFRIDGDNLSLISRDVGPGIPDIDLAMQEGFSTATEEIRMLGFGAGMGLPNMRRNCDGFSIESNGEGTTITMLFHLS
ncbi:ATP-binding protein [Eubacteriales bacterium OttesenSCG-928-M02]|nr:ATP-binding protein [Eubacteriales bacterium OttesenSCG-928-M02]